MHALKHSIRSRNTDLLVFGETGAMHDPQIRDAFSGFGCNPFAGERRGDISCIWTRKGRPCLTVLLTLHSPHYRSGCQQPYE